MSDGLSYPTGTPGDGFPELVKLGEVDSTNTYLAALWHQNKDLSAYSTVIASFQTSGKGRLGREWVAPRDTALLASILVPVRPELLSWVSLAAGVAAANLLGSLLPGELVRLKWPNDVVVDDRKIGGVLSEHLGLRRGFEWVALGVGINLTQQESELPIRSGAALPATSLRLEGGPDVVPELFAVAIAVELRELLDHAGVEGSPHLENAYSELSWTLGQAVQVHLPDGQTVLGQAVGIGEDGALLLRDSADQIQIIRAGDVIHARALQATEQLSGGTLDPFGR